jgi:hypothetical protein
LDEQEDEQIRNVHSPRGTPTGNYFNTGAGHRFYNTTSKWKINVIVFEFFKFTFLGGDNKSTN